METSSSSEEILHTDSIKSGALNSALHELRGLVHDLLRKEAKGACLACGADSNDKIRMEVQLHKSQEQNEKLERRLKEQEDLNKRKDDELLEAKSKVSSMQNIAFTQQQKNLNTILHQEDFLVNKKINNFFGLKY